jgi:hypothetical protein
VTVQFEQAANGIFHLPVTVTVLYRDGRADETVLVMTGARLEQTIPTSGDVRRVEINGDDAALGEFNVRERRVR